MSRSDHYSAIRNVLERTIALCVCEALHVDTEDMTGEDAVGIVGRFPDAVYNAEHAVMVIVDTACDEAVGEIVSRIRMAEGVDTVAVDAALGVEPEDDDIPSGGDLPHAL